VSEDPEPEVPKQFDSITGYFDVEITLTHAQDLYNRSIYIIRYYDFL
jgi:hypothetical protein